MKCLESLWYELSSCIISLEVENGVRRQVRLGLADEHANISRYLCNTYRQCYTNTAISYNSSNLNSVVNLSSCFKFETKIRGIFIEEYGKHIQPHKRDNLSLFMSYVSVTNHLWVARKLQTIRKTNEKPPHILHLKHVMEK